MTDRIGSGGVVVREWNPVRTGTLVFTFFVIVALGATSGFAQGIVLEQSPTQLAGPVYWFNPSLLATADFNSDGFPDLAVIFCSGPGVFRGTGILLSDGSGGFHPLKCQLTNPSTSPQGGLSWLGTGDLNGDGKPDLLVNSNDGYVGVYLSDGAGNFSVMPPFRVGQSAGSIAASDFNNDGKQDLAVANWRDGAIDVYLGDGSGSFSAPVVSSASTSLLVAEDFDHDGNQDLALAYMNVSVGLGYGTGAFQAASVIAGTDEAGYFEVGDFNGDGHADICVAIMTGPVVRTFFGDGTGAFPSSIDWSPGEFTIGGMRLGDLNGDGHLDLVLLDSESQLVNAYPGNGTGTFGSPATGPTGSYAIDLALVDLDGDGRKDIVTADFIERTVSMLRNVTPPPNTPSGTEVDVTPVDPTTGTTPAEITFGTVAETGSTTVVTNSEGPALPSGFQLGDPPTYYEIATTATYSGPIEVCISYAGVSYADEASLRLLHGLSTGEWEDVTTSLDIVNDLICGVSTSLSPFAVAERPNRAPVANAGADQVVEATSPSGAFVTLDGSGTSDPDGDSLSFVWTGPFGTAEGRTVTVQLPLGTSTVQLRVADALGASSTDSVEVIVRDTVAPTVTIDTPIQGVSYLLHANATAAYNCHDDGSGISTCSGPVPNGSPIATGQVGIATFVVNAVDAAGNSASRSVSYAVVYRFLGFRSPVDPLPVVNVVNAGRTIPVKWQLGDALGAYVADLGSFVSLQSSQVGCGSELTDTIPDSSTTLDPESLSFDPSSGQYIYQWRTDKAWTGTCRQIWLTLRDGSVQTAKFKFK